VSAAIGAPVCIMHGGKAAQVRRKAEERVPVAEAKAAVPATVVVQKEPEEILIDVLADTNTMLQGIKDQMRSNVVNPHLLGVCGEWFDRVARIAKVVTDGDLSTKLHNRLGWMAQDLASQLTALLAAVVEASPLTAQQKLALWQSRFDGLQLVADGRAPARMLGDATADFTGSLQVAAAAEKALADGIVWPESESDVDDESGSGSDGEVGSPVAVFEQWVGVGMMALYVPEDGPGEFSAGNGEGR
jgi:hypothetical protein